MISSEKTGVWGLEDVYLKANEAYWTYAGENGESPGELYIWGANAYGQVADNTIVDRSSPVQVPGTEWKKPSMDYYDVLSTKSDGTLWAWGYNNSGGLGDNSVIHISSPIQVPGTQWADDVVMRGRCSLARKTDNTLWSWGYNTYGGSGQNDIIPYSSPRQIPGTEWSATILNAGYSAGQQACLKSDGTWWNWGYNPYGSLGQNDRVNYSSPVQLSGTEWDTGLFKASFSQHGASGIKTDGTLWVWGSGDYGQMGDNNRVSYSSPVQLPGTEWKATSVTRHSSYLVKNDGTLWAMGRNHNGQLGHNNRTDRSSPTQIPGTQWVYAICSYYSAAGLKSDGTLWTWGESGYGQLGQNSSTVNLSSPTQIPGTGWDWVTGFVYGNSAIKLTS